MNGEIALALWSLAFLALGFGWGWLARDERDRQARAKAIAKRIVSLSSQRLSDLHGDEEQK